MSKKEITTKKFEHKILKINIEEIDRVEGIKKKHEFALRMIFKENFNIADDMWGAPLDENDATKRKKKKYRQKIQFFWKEGDGLPTSIAIIKTDEVNSETIKEEIGFVGKSISDLKASSKHEYKDDVFIFVMLDDWMTCTSYGYYNRYIKKEFIESDFGTKYTLNKILSEKESNTDLYKNTFANVSVVDIQNHDKKELKSFKSKEKIMQFDFDDFFQKITKIEGKYFVKNDKFTDENKEEKEWLDIKLSGANYLSIWNSKYDSFTEMQEAIKIIKENTKKLEYLEMEKKYTNLFQQEVKEFKEKEKCFSKMREAFLKKDENIYISWYEQDLPDRIFEFKMDGYATGPEDDGNYEEFFNWKYKEILKNILEERAEESAWMTFDNIKIIAKSKAIALKSGGYKTSANAKLLECIFFSYFDEETDKRYYFVDNKWSFIKGDFLEQLDNIFEQKISTYFEDSSDFGVWGADKEKEFVKNKESATDTTIAKEKDYLTRLSQENKWLLLDRKILDFKNGAKLELADILNGEEVIHVKKITSSHELSYVAVQAVASARIISDIKKGALSSAKNKQVDAFIEEMIKNHSTSKKCCNSKQDEECQYNDLSNKLKSVKTITIALGIKCTKGSIKKDECIECKGFKICAPYSNKGDLPKISVFAGRFSFLSTIRELEKSSDFGFKIKIINICKHALKTECQCLR